MSRIPSAIPCSRRRLAAVIVTICPVSAGDNICMTAQPSILSWPATAVRAPRLTPGFSTSSLERIRPQRRSPPVHVSIAALAGLLDESLPELELRRLPGVECPFEIVVAGQRFRECEPVGGGL